MEVSVVMAMAGRPSRSVTKRPTSSAAICWASAALPAVTAKQDFVPLSKGLYYQIADSFDVGKHLPVVQDIFFEPDTFLDGLGDIILHNFLISLVQRYDISEMKLAFDEIFKLSLLSPFQSAEESEEYAFFNIESSLLGI